MILDDGLVLRTDVPRREGHEENTDSENNSGDDLETEGDTPCSFALCLARSSDVVHTVVDPEGHHDTKGDS